MQYHHKPKTIFPHYQKQQVKQDSPQIYGFLNSPTSDLLSIQNINIGAAGIDTVVFLARQFPEDQQIEAYKPEVYRGLFFSKESTNKK